MNLRKLLRPAFALFGLLTLITGVLYPLLVTGLAQAAFPHQANGSVILRDGQPVGSELIGQPFDRPEYFWGRPSATATLPYNAFDAQNLTASSGSNLGPLSAELQRVVRERVEKLRAADPTNQAPIPVDLVTASGSGLDPHISVAAALYQLPRVARARGMDSEVLRALVDRYTEGRQLGLLGERRVNVLKLNLALDMAR
jgi:potassium-transporting ATPase KdpC subunit